MKQKATHLAWRSKTYIRYLFSFFGLLLSLVFVFSFVFRQNLLTSEENKLELKSMATVRQSALHVNTLLSVTDAVTNSIQNNLEASLYRITGSDLYRVRLCAALRQQHAFNALIENIFYIPIHDDLYLSSYSTYTRDTFNRLFARQRLNEAALAAYISKVNLAMTAFVDAVTDHVQATRDHDPVISMIYPLPNGGIGKYALMLIDIDQGKLQELMGVIAENTTLCLMSDQGEMLCESGGMTINAASLWQKSGDILSRSFSQHVINGEDCYVAGIGLQHGWSLYCLTPRAQLTQAVSEQTNSYVLSFIGILAVGFALSLLLALINYRPIALLKRRVLFGGEQPSRFTDDIKEIESGVHSIVQQNDHLSTQLSNNRQAIIGRHVFNLINNRTDETELRRLSEDGIRLRYNNYFIALFAPSLSTLIRHDGGWIAELETACPASFDAYFFEYQASKMYIGLFSVPPMSDETLRAKMDELRQMLPAPTTVALSRQTQSISNLAPQFIQAQLELQRRFYEGENHVYLDSASLQSKSTFQYPHALLHQIDIALSEKDEPAGQKALGDLF